MADNIQYVGKKELKAAFRVWEGSPSRTQEEFMRRNGLEYVMGGKHGRIQSVENPRIGIPVSCTPNGHGYAGLKIARDLAAYVLPFILAAGQYAR